MLNKNINFYLNSRIASNNSKPTKYSRLLVTLQGDLSLFSRGDEVQIYLFTWAFYTVIAIGSCWGVVVFVRCIIRAKCVNDNDSAKTIVTVLQTVFQ